MDYFSVKGLIAGTSKSGDLPTFDFQENDLIIQQNLWGYFDFLKDVEEFLR